MNKQQEALKLALEALEVLGWQPTEEAMDYRDNAIDAIRNALADSALDRMAENARELGLDYEAAQQQEPVTHCEAGPEYCPVCLAETRSLALAAAVGYVQRNTPQLVSEEICRALNKSSPTASKPWVGLTDEEIQTIWRNSEHMTVNQVCRAIEAKLKEKNT